MSRRMPEIFKFDELYEKILNSRSQEPKIRGNNLYARISNTGFLRGNRQITIRHYCTDIAVITEGRNPDPDAEKFYTLLIDNGGHKGNYTKHYLNDILDCYNTGIGIIQKNWEWYYVSELSKSRYTFRPIVFSGSENG